MKNFSILGIYVLTVAGCAGWEPRLPATSIAPFFDASIVYEWSYSVGEDPERLIPAILKFAEDNDHKVTAIFRTQGGFHSYTYAVFTESRVVITGISSLVTTVKGNGSYEPPRPNDLTLALEAEEKCGAWGEIGSDGIFGDFVVFENDGVLRICHEEFAFYGESNSISSYLWKRYGGDETEWTYDINADAT